MRLLLIELATGFFQIAGLAEGFIAHSHPVNGHLVTGKNKLSVNGTAVKERLPSALANSLELFESYHSGPWRCKYSG